MIVNNNGKSRVLKIKRIECETPEAVALWEEMYAPQKRQDIMERNARLRYGAKKRDAIAPKWQLDKHVRIVLKKGRTEIDNAFSAFIERVLAGEIEIGRMSLSGMPVVEEVAEEVAEEVKPPKKEKKPRAKREDKED